MPELSPELEGAPFIIEIEGAGQEVADELSALFTEDGDDVTSAHSFGGAAIVTILTELSKSTLGKLVEAWGKLKLSSPKTTFRIDKTSITMNGFGRADLEALLASPDFQKAVRNVRKK